MLFCGRWRRCQVTCHCFTSWKNKRILLHLRSSTQLNSKIISLHRNVLVRGAFPQSGRAQIGARAKTQRSRGWLIGCSRFNWRAQKNAENRFVLELLATQAIIKFEGYHVILLFQSFTAELCNLIIIKNSCRVPYPIRAHIYFFDQSEANWKETVKLNASIKSFPAFEVTYQVLKGRVWLHLT